MVYHFQRLVIVIPFYYVYATQHCGTECVEEVLL